MLISRKRFAFFSLFFFFAVEAVLPVNLEELIGDELRISLLSGEKPVLAQFGANLPRLAPKHEVSQAFIEELRRELNPSVIVETAHLYKKPSGSGAWTDAQEAELYNSILALSTLTGLQYYSASRGVMRTLYELSSVIDGPSTKKPLPDPVYQRPPSKLSLYARQKDMTFGDNVYQYDFLNFPEVIILTQQNLTTLSMGIIPAIGKNNLRAVIAAFDAEDYILVYTVSMAKAASLPGMKERISNSLANRADAIFNWFVNCAGRTFAKP